MKNLFKKLKDIFTAVAFAKSGEFEAARDIMKEKDGPQERKHISPSKKAKGLRVYIFKGVYFKRKRT